jgi:hypothetical protein
MSGQQHAAMDTRTELFLTEVPRFLEAKTLTSVSSKGKDANLTNDEKKGLHNKCPKRAMVHLPLA